MRIKKSIGEISIEASPRIYAGKPLCRIGGAAKAGDYQLLPLDTPRQGCTHYLFVRGSPAIGLTMGEAAEIQHLLDQAAAESAECRQAAAEREYNSLCATYRGYQEEASAAASSWQDRGDGDPGAAFAKADIWEARAKEALAKIREWRQMHPDFMAAKAAREAASLKRHMWD
jgi:hypothetical protein